MEALGFFRCLARLCAFPQPLTAMCFLYQNCGLIVVDGDLKITTPQVGEGAALLTLFFRACLLSKTLAVGTESMLIARIWDGYVAEHQKVNLLSWLIPTHISQFNVAEADFWGAGQLAPN